MASKLNVNLTDLQSLVVSPTLLSRSDSQSTRLDGHDTSLNTVFASLSSYVQNTGATFTGDVTVEGNFTVTGTYADVKNLDLSDNLIGLNRGLTTRDENRDAGILIERGDRQNVFMGFDESAEKFTMGTTDSLPNHTGNMQNFTAGTLVANTEGTHTGAVSGNVTGNVDGVVGGNTPALGTFTGVALTHLCHKTQSFQLQLDIHTYATNFQSPNIIVDAVIANTAPLMLDLDGLPSATHIVIKNAYVKLNQGSTHTGTTHEGMLTLGPDGAQADNRTLLQQGVANKEILGANIDIMTTGNALQTFLNNGVITEIANVRLYFLNKTQYNDVEVAGNAPGASGPVSIDVVLDYDLLAL